MLVVLVVSCVSCVSCVSGWCVAALCVSKRSAAGVGGGFVSEQ